MLVKLHGFAQLRHWGRGVGLQEEQPPCRRVTPFFWFYLFVH